MRAMVRMGPTGAGSGPMRLPCETVQLELTVPTGRLAAEALRAHLHSCPTCAALAHGLARLDALWAASRPAEPAPVVVDGLWSRLQQALETGAPEPAVPLTPLARPAPELDAERPGVAARPALDLVPGPGTTQGPTRRRGWRVALLTSLAAAAAVLLMAMPRLWTLGPIPAPASGAGTASRAAVDPQAPAPQLLAYELEQGETAIIRIGAAGSTLVVPGAADVSDTEPVLAAFDVYNYMESIGSEGSL